MTGTKPEDILFVCVLQFLAFSLKSDVSVSIGFVWANTDTKVYLFRI